MTVFDWTIQELGTSLPEAETIKNMLARRQRMICCLQRSMHHALALASLARENGDNPKAGRYEAAATWYAYALSVAAASIPRLIEVMEPLAC
jgi:hypothetical protein